MFEGCAVQERLERRAGLTGLDRHVERAACTFVRDAADHRPDAPRAGFDHQHGSVGDTIGGERLDAGAGEPGGFLVKAGIERGLDDEPVLAGEAGRDAREFIEDEPHELRSDRRGNLGQGLDRPGAGCGRFGLRDDAVIAHAAEHVRLALAGGRIIEGVAIGGGQLGEAGEVCGAREVQVRCAHPEIHARGGFDAIRPAAVVHIVQVEGQELVLAPVRVKLKGREGFAHLADRGGDRRRRGSTACARAAG